MCLEYSDLFGRGPVPAQAGKLSEARSEVLPSRFDTNNNNNNNNNSNNNNNNIARTHKEDTVQNPGFRKR